MDTWIVENNSAGGYSVVGYNVIFHCNRISFRMAITTTVNVDGQGNSAVRQGMSYGSGGHDTIMISGSTTIYHTSAKTIGFSFNINFQNGIYYSGLGRVYNIGASGSLDLPQLAVNPTLPTWVDVSGGAGGAWVNKDNPTFNVSWGGATCGTYYIDAYSVDVAKYGQNNWADTGTEWVSNSGGGNVSRNIASAFGVNGGDKIQVRIGMRTNNGTWWGHTYWGGVLNVYSSPTAPTTFIAPTSVEIDQGFNLTWSGAKAGSNGIAGYDLQARAYNGSSWTGWETVFSCKNQTSYSVSKIKNLTVNGVNFSNNGENIKFQYRIRTSDGQIATSDWKESSQIGIKINSPSTPRNSIINRNNVWENETSDSNYC